MNDEENGSRLHQKGDGYVVLLIMCEISKLLNHNSRSPYIPYWVMPVVNDEENGSQLHP